MNNYVVSNNLKQGKFIDVSQFYTNPSITDSQAIDMALSAANKENAFVYLGEKTYKIDKQIKIDVNNSNVKGLFGDGMGKTKIIFDKPQEGVNNPNTNDTDLRADAGILIDKVNGKVVQDLSVEYQGEFYRKGESYFGKVNGIIVNDADNTLIKSVEVSGANRAGILFTSTDAIASGGKKNLILGKIDESEIPVGENNMVLDSYLHHNRVAGIFSAYQKDFLAHGNTLERNGHPDDGGTGYGFATVAGSYNKGITVSNNITNHNYRKGIDSHDGNDITIKDNILNGDRLYGIAVENRQFTMNKVKITGNIINHDKDFKMTIEDDLDINTLNNDYVGYRGIKLENKAQTFQKFHNIKEGVFEITGNKIYNIADTGIGNGRGLTRAIEARNNEKDATYKLDIKDNLIESKEEYGSTDNLIAIFGNSDTRGTKEIEKGFGSGKITIENNRFDMKEVKDVPIYIEEKNHANKFHGEIKIDNNQLIVEKSNGYTEAIAITSNPEKISIQNNEFELHGKIDRPVVRLGGSKAISEIDGIIDININKNTFVTDEGVKSFSNGDWFNIGIATAQRDLKITNNLHNGTSNIYRNKVVEIAEETPPTTSNPNNESENIGNTNIVNTQANQSQNNESTNVENNNSTSNSQPEVPSQPNEKVDSTTETIAPPTVDNTTPVVTPPVIADIGKDTIVGEKPTVENTKVELSDIKLNDIELINIDNILDGGNKLDLDNSLNSLFGDSQALNHGITLSTETTKDYSYETPINLEPLVFENYNFI